MELADPARRERSMHGVVFREPLRANVLEKEPAAPICLLKRSIVRRRRNAEVR
jgi:hypothetical protein